MAKKKKSKEIVGKTHAEVAAERASDDGEVFPHQLPAQTKSGLTQLQRTVVQLYAKGKSRGAVARLLGDHLGPRPAKKLRAWEETQWFRDAVYDASVVHTDLQIPTILRGVVRRAKRGRTDAARLALEVTGRHNPRGEDTQPAVVNINFGGLPRPANRPITAPADLELEEGDVVEEEN